jgi:hypothetical protein
MAYSGYEDSFTDTLKKFAPLLATILAVVVVIAGLFFGLRWYFNDGTGDVSEETFVRDWNYKTGNNESTGIQLIYLFDFQCPACASNDQIIQSMIPELENEVEFVFKNFPLTSIHPFAKPAAYGGQAVIRVDETKYLEYKSLVFERQNRLSNSTIEEIVREIGIDFETWEDFYNSSEIRDEVDQDLEDVTNIELVESSYDQGVTTPQSTPSTVIFKDGQSVDWWSGVVPLDEQVSRVEQIIADES